MTDLQQLLLSLASRDQEAAQRILQRGDLEDTYHAELEAIHISNAKQLELIIDRQGLPGSSEVGEDGAEAVWLIIQHAISLPEFQRRCLVLLKEASTRGDFPAAYAAYLEDRISVNEGRPQRYGTQYDWNEEGELVPYEIEEPNIVDKLRGEVGLQPLAENTMRLRSQTQKPPKDYAAKKQEYELWLKQVGWRTS